MDIKRKLEIVDSALESLAKHYDADAAVLDAALAKVAEMVARKRAHLAEVVAQRVVEDIG